MSGGNFNNTMGQSQQMGFGQGNNSGYGNSGIAGLFSQIEGLFGGGNSFMGSNSSTGYGGNRTQQNFAPVTQSQYYNPNSGYAGTQQTQYNAYAPQQPQAYQQGPNGPIPVNQSQMPPGGLNYGQATNYQGVAGQGGGPKEYVQPGQQVMTSNGIITYSGQ